jgi:hypothetical protein
MAAAGPRKRPTGDNEDSSDSRKKEAIKKPRQVNAWGNDDDDDDKEEVQLEEPVVVQDKAAAAAEQEDEEVEEDDNHDNKEAVEFDDDQVMTVAEKGVPVLSMERLFWSSADHSAARF